METTIEIKSKSGGVIFSYTCEDNSVKKTVEATVRDKALLSDANLRDAYLRGADLCGADLRGADLRGAYLYGVKVNHVTAMFFPQCPDGEFVGYKKAGGKIVKLLIPEDAKRSSATTLKCRCSKAKVLEIQELDGSPSEAIGVRSNFDKSFVYRVGDTVSVDDFDDCRWNECSKGIHFFISRDAAVSYEG